MCLYTMLTASVICPSILSRERKEHITSHMWLSSRGVLCARLAVGFGTGRQCSCHRAPANIPKFESRTFLQAEGPDGTVVAVKALSLRRMTDWKQLELFEREAKTLKSLDHPGIPKYIDYLSEDTEKDRGFFLVQASP